jgi:DNA-directed RNA polymerase specialized sigma subunit
MRSSSEDAGSAVPRSAEVAELEELYRSIGSVLLRTLADMYGISREEAERIVGEVFMMYVSTSEPGGDPASWIHLAVHAEAARYRRSVALAALPEDAREALRLRFQEKRTYPEIAAALGVTKRFAEKLVAKALAELRARGLR